MTQSHAVAALAFFGPATTAAPRCREHQVAGIRPEGAPRDPGCNAEKLEEWVPGFGVVNFEHRVLLIMWKDPLLERASERPPRRPTTHV